MQVSNPRNKLSPKDGSLPCPCMVTGRWRTTRLTCIKCVLQWGSVPFITFLLMQSHKLSLKVTTN